MSTQIIAVHLWDINADRSVQTLIRGGPNRINVDDAPAPTLTIRVEVDRNAAGVGSARFDWDGDADYQVERRPPYFISGDVTDAAGRRVVLPWGGLSEGRHALTATLHASADGSGPALDTFAAALVVDDRSTAAVPATGLPGAGVPAEPRAPDPPAGPPPANQPRPGPGRPPVWGRPPDDEAGWTYFPPLQAAGDRQVRVNPDGSGDVRTIADGYRLLRDGTGDQLLLRRGKTFAEPVLIWRKSGRRARQPLVISAYGPPAEPRPRWLARGGGIRLGSGVRHVAVTHLDLVPPGRDPGEPGFRRDDESVPVGIDMRADGLADILIEGNRLDFWGTGIATHQVRDLRRQHQRLIVRRNVVSFNWAIPAFHGQGMYAAGWDDVLIEENIWYSCGWVPRTPATRAAVYTQSTPYRHCNYLGEHGNSGYRVRRNLYLFGCSYGCQYRCAGLTSEDNFFFDNQSAASAAGTDGVFRDNVVFAGHAHESGPSRGSGATGFSLNAARTEATGNIVVKLDYLPIRWEGGAFEFARVKWTPKDPPPMAPPRLADNIVYGYRALPYVDRGKRKPLPPAANPPPARTPDRVEDCLPTAPWDELKQRRWDAMTRQRMGDWKTELMADALNRQVRAAFGR